MTLTAEQIATLQAYRDKSFVSSILCEESSNFYSNCKNIVNLPLIFTSSIMTILNSSSFIKPDDIQIANIVLNAATSIILSLINNFKLPEKAQVFKTLSSKYNKLTHAIEDSLTNDTDVSVDKLRSFITDFDSITESLDFTYPTFIKNRCRKRYKNRRTLPNVLNCQIDFIEIKRNSIITTTNTTDIVNISNEV